MSRRLTSVVAAVAFVVLATPVFTQSMKPIDFITEVSIRSHMEFLASDALAGRGSGTRDEWLAALYIGSQLKRWGLGPAGDNGGFVQEIEIARGELAAPPTLTTDKLKLTHGRDVLVQTIGTPHASGPLVKFAKGITIPAGAVVLVLGTDAPDAQAVTAAAAVITPETDQSRARWDATAANTRVVPQPGRPWRVVADARTYLAMSQTADGTVVKFDAEIRPGHTYNAVAVLRGTDPVLKDEAILLSAHLDHLGTRGAGADTINNGADDDASGCVAVLALAEAMAMGKRPKRTVIFGFFGSEESGGFGSRYLADHPPVPLEKIVANLQFEMLGRPDEKVPPHTLWLTGYERSNLGPELAKHGAKLVQDPHPEQSFFTRSDNIQFAYRGIVAHTVSSYGLHKEYHTPADEIRLIDFAHMTDAIRSMYAPIEWLVNGNFKPDWLPGMKPAPRGGRGGGPPIGM
ncbi:MAG TPA: M20/M25/M40 family metallo-hydrolase [Vicinamibacterales bacterium]|nr:M20/M25/M40 family metallo-hydrolase [Vicinamibacterales bacterium]